MKKLLFLFIFIMFASPTSIQALDCAIPSLEEGYAEYDGVIVGFVKDISKKESGNILKVNVKQSFKGVTKTWILVEEDHFWGDSKKGEEYLFFLKEKNETEWDHPLCSPTSNVSNVQEEIEELQKGKLIDLELTQQPMLDLDDNPEPDESTIDEVIVALVFTVVLGLVIYVKYRLGKMR
ncbi:hypothetical protein HNQ94_003193 [Salirhabdus euzebyi]|uniref:CbiN domain protein n=1 Tax=Salirhabdus euzebyi TaxID=394506 RepID=A0A841Q8R2_9BACI|nr:hypothetical protein [Salirhabdus euzebyi]MBB6454704.1 hypothetical protein [Salirhabdus euzebyi]